MCVPVAPRDTCDNIADETRVIVREIMLGLTQNYTDNSDPCGSDSNPCPESLPDCGCNGHPIGVYSVTPLIGTSVYRVEVDECYLTKGSYKVYNSLGGVVRSGQFYLEDHLFYLNLRNLNRGIYKLRIEGINCAGKSKDFSFSITHAIFANEGSATSVPPVTPTSQPATSEPGASFNVVDVEVSCLL